MTENDPGITGNPDDQPQTTPDAQGSTTLAAPPEMAARTALLKRVKAIEARWGKSFDEVLLDLHDHVFGKSESVGQDNAE